MEYSNQRQSTRAKTPVVVMNCNWNTSASTWRDPADDHNHGMENEDNGVIVAEDNISVLITMTRITSLVMTGVVDSHICAEEDHMLFQDTQVAQTDQTLQTFVGHVVPYCHKFNVRQVPK